MKKNRQPQLWNSAGWNTTQSQEWFCELQSLGGLPHSQKGPEPQSVRIRLQKHGAWGTGIWGYPRRPRRLQLIRTQMVDVGVDLGDRACSYALSIITTWGSSWAFSAVFMTDFSNNLISCTSVDLVIQTLKTPDWPFSLPHLEPMCLGYQPKSIS